jgi:hypothetical protein
MSKAPSDEVSLSSVLKGGGRCRIRIVAGAVTGFLVGIVVAIALGNTFFKGGDDLDHASFWSVVVIFGLIGLRGGAWGGALLAKCWDDDGNKPPSSTRDDPESA